MFPSNRHAEIKITPQSSVRIATASTIAKIIIPCKCDTHQSMFDIMVYNTMHPKKMHTTPINNNSAVFIL